MTEDDTRTKADTFIRYCMTIAPEFKARLDRIRAFVKQHNLTSGTTNEAILRDFLSRHAPKNFHVGQGFICDPSQEDQVSKQCDILVYDQSRYPIVYEDGPIKVAWSDSAKMVIEVKTQLQKNEIQSALENIKSIREVNINTIGIIFAFYSASLSTIKSHLQEYLPSISTSHNPSAILLFDEGVIIRREAHNTYSIRKAEEENKNAVVIAYLLLAFFDAVLRPSPFTNSAGAVDILLEMLKKYTDEDSTISF
jgi:hypothetical protein